MANPLAPPPNTPPRFCGMPGLSRPPKTPPMWGGGAMVSNGFGVAKAWFCTCGAGWAAGPHTGAVVAAKGLEGVDPGDTPKAEVAPKAGCCCDC